MDEQMDFLRLENYLTLPPEEFFHRRKEENFLILFLGAVENPVPFVDHFFEQFWKLNSNFSQNLLSLYPLSTPLLELFLKRLEPELRRGIEEEIHLQLFQLGEEVLSLFRRLINLSTYRNRDRIFQLQSRVEELNRSLEKARQEVALQQEKVKRDSELRELTQQLKQLQERFGNREKLRREVEELKGLVKELKRLQQEVEASQQLFKNLPKGCGE
ncbi:MAG: hypothetical protein ABGW77_00695 [Campylobacterales bacterium]